jgi:transposase
MCLHPCVVYQVPDQTAQVAHAILPHGNLCLRLYDELGSIYSDPLFADLFSRRGHPAASPTRLALVLVVQFLENLTDRQAADAVRLRIDWKYLLGLELTDRGFHYSVLSEFRDRLVAHDPATLLLDSLLTRVQELDLYRPRGRPRTDSTHILAAIQTLNRLELGGRTLQQALNALAQTAPAWLRTWVPPTYFDRYGRLIDECRLPQETAAPQTLATQIGADGFQLLAQLEQTETGALLCALPEVQLVHQVWAQQYTLIDDQAHWRATDEQPPCAERITSPHDPDARYSTKRSVSWIGYKAHLTETCDDDLPHLIIHVETSPASEDDGTALPRIHTDLAREERLPHVHLVDTTYASAELLVQSQAQYQVELIAPVRPDVSWQAQDPEAFALGAFQIDWTNQQATCPQG